jgi:aerobic carbon-monoxide dehydrogenase small subunit
MEAYVKLLINDHECEVTLRRQDMTLLEVLREDLALTGTKEGCGEGECGACTILMDDLAVNACLVLAQQAAGHRIVTIEGVTSESPWRAVQEAFVQHAAVQCGYCTPGMVMSAIALLHRNPTPNREQIRAGLSGNLCRCTGYVKIVDAVAAAAEALSTPDRT